MKRSILKAVLVLVVFSLLLTLVSYSAFALYKVIGYCYGGTSGIDATKLTHINYAFASIVNGQVQDPGGLSNLTSLKSQNPNLKIILSVGGWGAEGFCDAAATDASRTTFANSCYNVIYNNNIDGIDLDWEYPVNGGWGMIKCSPADKQNFTLLLQAIRNRIGSGKLLTIASGASQEYANNVEFSRINGICDFINMMTYDFGASRHNANLYESSLNGSTGISGDLATTIHINSGVAASKINMGVPFYGRAGSAWPAYSELVASYINKNGYTRYWDSAAQACYLSGPMFVTYDDPETFNYKCNYIKSRGLGGVMFWQAGHDPSLTLLNTLWNNLNAGAPNPTPTPIATPTPSGAPVSLVNNAIYRIEPACAPGKCLDVAEVSTADGANVHIWTYGGGANQQWKAVDVGGGYWKFLPQHAPGKALDVYAASSADNTNVQQYTDNSTNAQKWKLYDAGNGYIKLEPACAPGKVLDVYYGTNADGTNVEIYTALGNTAQQWKFYNLGGPNPTPTVTKTPTATKTPSGAVTPTKTPTPSGGGSAWQPNTYYAVGVQVTYGGHTYKCIQAHTSLVGWEPPNVPALWQLVS